MTALPFRIGLGYDVHRLARGESLILGGVPIPSDVGTVAHSDGDVLLHAICDALLGALALGDIGEHFPDTDEQYRGASSIELLRSCLAMLDEHGWRPGNLDATLMLERPKILPHKDAMRRSIAEAMDLPLDCISLKATTGEGIGFVGRGSGVEAQAVVLLLPKG